MSKVVHRKKRLSSFKLIVLGFAAVIFVGALLLMLPVSSVSGTQTPFHEALFTSVSAVCVQGLLYRTPAVTGLLLDRQLFCCWSRPAGWVSSPLLFPLPFYPDGKFRSCSAVQCRMQFLHRKSAVLSAWPNSAYRVHCLLNCSAWLPCFRFSSVIMASKASGWQPFTLYLQSGAGWWTRKIHNKKEYGRNYNK